MLKSFKDTCEAIETGAFLVIAADESLLARLPKGNWIGGTIPYFFSADGGLMTRDELFVRRLPDIATRASIGVYDQASIASIGVDSPENGYTILVLPAFSPLLEAYALKAPTYPELFMKVIAGWIAGRHLAESQAIPRVFDGRAGTSFDNAGVALHVELPASHRAQVGIVNIFRPGDGDVLTFLKSGFEVDECLVNGARAKMFDYLQAMKIDTRLPLVADFNGVMINQSVASITPRRTTCTCTRRCLRASTTNSPRRSPTTGASCSGRSARR